MSSALAVTLHEQKRCRPRLRKRSHPHTTSDRTVAAPPPLPSQDPAASAVLAADDAIVITASPDFMARPWLEQYLKVSSAGRERGGVGVVWTST
jgi:hypothetical protein